LKNKLSMLRPENLGTYSFACQSMSWLEHYNYYTGVSKIWTAQLSAG